MNITVVIPNFNGGHLLQKNLPVIVDVLHTYKGGKADIVVADDASSDNSLAILRNLQEKYKDKLTITVLENTGGKNKGFSSNVNIGVRNAVGDIVVLLNTDVCPEKNFLAPLLSHFSDPSVFAVGCMDKSVEHGKEVLRGRGVGKWRRGFLIHAAGHIDKKNTLWVSAGSGAFRKSIWDKLGGLCALYNPFYWEDIDICYRAQKAGYAIIFEHDSIVKHEHEIGSIKSNYKSEEVKAIAYRNQFFFTWLNATDTMLLVSHIIFLPYFLLKAILSKDMAFLFGFFHACTSLSDVLHERKRVQSLVKKTDAEVVGQFATDV